MGRRKGSLRAAASYQTPPVCEMSLEDRMRLIANIIVDSIQAELEKIKSEDTEVTANV